MAERPLTNPEMLVGGTRAVLGQGFGMGWGDEAEAWLRAKLLGQGAEEELLKRIRSEYGTFASQYPMTALAGEITGGMVPGAAMMMVPGMQPVGAAQTAGTLARLARIAKGPIVSGAATGAVAGAGSADEETRGAGAVTGGVVGGAFGAALPPLVRGTTGLIGGLLGRAFPTESSAARKAARLMSESAEKAKMTPQQIEAAMAADRAAGIPSTIANVAPAFERRARGAAKMGGTGTETIVERLTQQKDDAPERVKRQVALAMQPGDYFDDLASLRQSLRTKAAPYYEAAYARGEIDDPEVLKFLKLPQFRSAIQEARKQLAAEGRELPITTVEMPTVSAKGAAAGPMVETFRPTVEVLDLIKQRGLDPLIEKETDAVTGKVSSLGRIYIQKKKEFLEALDAVAPEYAQARAIYRGDAELMDAMRAGMEKFPTMKHEEVARLVSGFSDAEKEAFKTGVARTLYATAMERKTSVDVAGRIINAREMQEKLRPLFKSDAEFDLFKAAMLRESQLFKAASRVLGGSDTAENQQLIRDITGGDSGWLTNTLESVASGSGWGRSLANSALKALSNAQMNDKTATKLADMLMSSDPADVAAVVNVLEEYAKRQAPRAAAFEKLQRGAVTGTAVAAAPAPPPDITPTTIEEALRQRLDVNPAAQSAIEAAIEADRRRRQQ
jgi:hypothetical protein